MHIALCDDNVADRKQFERLAKRESDCRAASDGILFVDSFGNAESLLANPRQYDVFFIDVCHTPGVTGFDLAASLIDLGINTPIVMCCSEIDYRQQAFPGNVLFLEKPIRVSEFRSCLDTILGILSAREPLIEIRNDGKTIYVKEQEIIYAVEKGGLLEITLTENRTFVLMETAKNFFAQLESWPTFFCPSGKTVLNSRYIETLKGNKAVVKDGRKFRVSLTCLPFARAMYQKYNQNGESS